MLYFDEYAPTIERRSKISGDEVEIEKGELKILMGVQTEHWFPATM